MSTHVTALQTEKQVISTHSVDVLCTQPCDTTGITPCTHEEADTRILLHVSHAVNQGYKRVSIRTVDTDVLVLSIKAAEILDDIELWIVFGVGKSVRYLPAHKIAVALGPDRCMALPMFHAFTGCNIQCHTLEAEERRLPGIPG